MECLTLKKANCKNCYKCIRHCPVKAIRFSGNQAYIIQDECIMCGQCFVVCPQDAKQIVSEVGKVRVMLQSGAPVVASLAPLLHLGVVRPRGQCPGQKRQCTLFLWRRLQRFPEQLNLLHRRTRLSRPHSAPRLFWYEARLSAVFGCI